MYEKKSSLKRVEGKGATFGNEESIRLKSKETVLWLLNLCPTEYRLPILNLLVCTLELNN